VTALSTYHQGLLSPDEPDQLTRLLDGSGRSPRRPKCERSERPSAETSRAGEAGDLHDRIGPFGPRRRGERVPLGDFAEQEIVTLSPLPCWQGLSPEEIRERIAELVGSIERQHAERRRAEGKGVLGAKAVRRRHPHSKPEKLRRSPAPETGHGSSEIGCPPPR